VPGRCPRARQSARRGQGSDAAAKYSTDNRAGSCTVSSFIAVQGPRCVLRVAAVPVIRDNADFGVLEAGSFQPLHGMGGFLKFVKKTDDGLLGHCNAPKIDCAALAARAGRGAHTEDAPAERDSH